MDSQRTYASAPSKAESCPVEETSRAANKATPGVRLASPLAQGGGVGEGVPPADRYKAQLLDLQRHHGNRFVQRMMEPPAHAGEAPVASGQAADNRTGLPDHLKQGVEALSGLTMDDVRVHYNSAKPTGFQALAYTQGADIYLRPGQEKYLAHEAWHVVQQKQGRVQPTGTINGAGLNDSRRLEGEADRLGSQALRVRGAFSPILRSQPIRRGVVQGMFEVEADSFAELIPEQMQKQKAAKKKGFKNKEPFTTVGFEHEFAQMETGRLRGVSHLEIAKSQETLPYTKIPFTLETDASNALELVSPPFLIKTLPGRPVPDPKEIEKVDNLIRATLIKQTTEGPTMREMVAAFKTDPGLTFPLTDVEVTPANMTQNTRFNVSWWEKTIRKKTIKSIRLKTSEKNGGITSQVNFATDAETFELMQQINDQQPDPDLTTLQGQSPVKDLGQLEGQFKQILFAVGLPDLNEALTLTQAEIHKTAAAIAAQIKVLEAAVKDLVRSEHLDYDSQTQLAKDMKALQNLFVVGSLGDGGKLKQLRGLTVDPTMTPLEVQRKQRLFHHLADDFVKKANGLFGSGKVTKEGATALADLPAVKSGHEEVTVCIKAVDKAFAASYQASAENKNLHVFYTLLARTLAGQLSVPTMRAVRNAQKKRFNLGALANFNLPYEQLLSSRVKDVHGIWIKDSILSLGAGLLNAKQWTQVAQAINDKDVRKAMSKIDLTKLDLYAERTAPTDEFNASVQGALDQLSGNIKEFDLTNPDTEVSKLPVGPSQRPDFMSHDPTWIGARQDTYIPAKHVQMPKVWPGKRLHVVETRFAGATSLKNLGQFLEEQSRTQSTQPTVTSPAKTTTSDPTSGDASPKVTEKAPSLTTSAKTDIDPSTIKAPSGKKLPKSKKRQEKLSKIRLDAPSSASAANAYKILQAESRLHGEVRVAKDDDPSSGKASQTSKSGPSSDFATRQKLDRENYSQTTRQLGKWLNTQGITSIPNGGQGKNNCLIISLLQHASGDYRSPDPTVVETYKALLTKHGVGPSAALLPDDAAFKTLITKINKDFDRDLKVYYIQANASTDPPYSFLECDIGSEPVVVWDQVGHFEALVA